MKLLFASLLLLSACSAPASVTVPSPQSPIPSPQTTNSTVKGWTVTINAVEQPGQKYRTFEAKDNWTVVKVNFQNNTGKRQKITDAPLSLIASEIIDSNQNRYQIQEFDFDYAPELMDKPMNPGEAREQILLFDTPKNIKATALVLNAFDEGIAPIKL